MSSKVVFVSGPYRADTVNDIFENIARARAAALRLWKQGYVVICPHMNTAFMDGTCDDSVWLEGDLEILARCDIVYMMNGWERSSGAVAEFHFAREHGLHIVYGMEGDY